MRSTYSPGGVRGQAHDPMEDTPIHRILVAADALQNVPIWAMYASFAINALAIMLIWSAPDDVAYTLIAGVISFASSIGAWTMLWLLPKAHRSWGPDRPSALALSALITVGLALIGIFDGAHELGAGFALIVLCIALYATWFEPFNLRVTNEVLMTPRWKGKPLRMLHIGDIHVERLGPREIQLNQLIKDLKPDVIVFSGDFVNLSYNADEQAKTDIRRLLLTWKAPLGVYCVTGTPVVESVERVKEFVAGMDNLTLLVNRWVTVQHDAQSAALHICGMRTTHILDDDRGQVGSLGKLKPTDGVSLLLTHSPDVAPEAADLGFDLYVCGHTHGGQLRLPLIGALATGSAYGRRFVMGRKQIKEMTLYTSRGVGMEGLGAPRARFLCSPEITLWEIRGK